MVEEEVTLVYSPPLRLCDRHCRVKNCVVVVAELWLGFDLLTTLTLTLTLTLTAAVIRFISTHQQRCCWLCLEMGSEVSAMQLQQMMLRISSSEERGVFGTSDTINRVKRTNAK